jgi:phosphatidylglycerophosphate synthase
MQEIKRNFISFYSEEEARILVPWQRARQQILVPVAAVLARLGISPAMLSFTSAALGIGFCLLASFQFPLAFRLPFVSVICDGLDGVVARHTKTDTVGGSMIDLFCGQVVAAFSAAGMTWIGAIHPVLAAIFVFMYTASGTFLVLHQLLQVSSLWIIRPDRTLLIVKSAID